MLPIPEFIKKQLRDHILSECVNAQAGWEFANQDEDTLTGDFFGRLRTGWRTSDQFEWRFVYNKIRGRGKGAMEKKIGTDGIITLSYRDNTMGVDYHKSIVFQAKKINGQVDQKQWDKMKQFFPNGNMIVSYGPTCYYSLIGDINTKEDVCETIARKFLDCSIGIEGLYYDHIANQFVRPTSIPVAGTVKHELLIDIFKNPY